MGVETYVNLMVQCFIFPPTFFSIWFLASLSGKLQPLLMGDKLTRNDLVWTRLLFIPSLPVTTPPPQPGLSWQALISLPNRLQTWGFAISHRDAHGMGPSFQRECGGTWCSDGSIAALSGLENSVCHLALSVKPIQICWEERMGVRAPEEELRSCYIMPEC